MPDEVPTDSLLPGSAPPTRFRWAIVALLAAVAFVLYVDRVNIQVAGLPMQEEFGLSDHALGRIWSAFLFGYAIGLVPGGWLADRFGAHRVLMAAAVSWGLITLAFGCMRPLHVAGRALDVEATLFTLRFVLGLCEACAFPTFSRAMANWMRRSERALASGLIHCGSGLGGAFTPVFIALVVEHLGWRESFFLSGLLTFGVALAWWRLAGDHPRQHRRVSEAEVRLIAAEKEETRHEPADRAWYGRMVRSRNAWLLCLSEFFYGLTGFVFLTWFYKYFVEVREAGPLGSAGMASVNYLAMAVGATLGGLLCDRCVRRFGAPWGRRLVPLVVITASGCSSIVAPIVENNAVSAGLFALSAGLLLTAASAYWSTLIDITRRGPGVLGGLMNGCGSLGSALATNWFAPLRDVLGWEPALQLGGLMGILSGLLWLGIDSSRQID